MENIITRHRNLTILALVLFAQVLGLAVQVKRETERGSMRLIRVWTVSAITPLEKAFVHSTTWAVNVWHDYFYLHNVRKQNEALREEIQRLHLAQARLSEDASQGRRLQALLGFKQQFISQTVAAQVISTTGSDFSRGLYIDKGSRDGIKPDMPVITPDGIVGKVYRVYPASSLVLVINDPTSGAGVILEKSRLQGILKGLPNGETYVANIMADEQIQPGERVLTSGGDRVYPKGLEVGTVTRIAPAGSFLNIQVKPAAHLDRVEEVLVITKVAEKAPDADELSPPLRAVDILVNRLPTASPPKPQTATAGAPTEPKTAAVNPGAAERAVSPRIVSDAPVPASATPLANDEQAAPKKTKPTDAKENPGPGANANPVAQQAKPDNSSKDAPH